MSRRPLRSVCVLVALAVVAGSPAGWGLTRGAAQAPKPPDGKAPDGKKADPKKPDAKKPEPKKPEPKPEPKKPEPAPAAPVVEAPLPLTAGPPNPLDLVRGLREQGMADLAMEYLQELDKKPGVSAAVKEEIPLERAKCQLDAANDEPDEGTRISLVGEAKEGFHTFLKNAPTHSRAAETHLALARLSSLEAKAQLAKSRRIDVPPAGGEGADEAARTEAIKKAQQEAAAARPLFKTAAAEFSSASKLVQAQLEKTTDPAARRSLAQLQYEAELARGNNQFALSDTYPYPSTAEQKERSDLIDAAQNIFAALAEQAGAPARVTGVARAWMAECEYEKSDLKAAEDEFKRIETATGPDAEDAKRMARFFKLRHAFIGALSGQPTPAAAELLARDWLRQYGAVRRAQSEAIAARWYLAYLLHLQGDILVGPKPKPKNPPAKPTPLPAAARVRYQEAEKLYRAISQTDNEYSYRAARQRMIVVRHLLGEADRPISEYRTFEECQMASLIQMSRLLDLEKDREKNAEEIKKKHLTVVALLERARELATDKDNPADVTDVLLRLIRAYKDTNQPYQSAVLGEFVARNVKSTGGKSAVAGALAIVEYTGAAGQIRLTDAEKLDAARKSDRERAIRLARFLDEKLPNDTATDFARYRLALLLNEDGKPVEAYDALLKVRPGYDQITQARLVQAGLAYQLLAAKTDSPLPPDRRREVFRRTTADLDKLVRPRADAPEPEVRAYLTARCRLALMYLMQGRVDPEGNKIDPGYVHARKVADEAFALVPTFAGLTRDEAGAKTPNLDGWEMKLLAEDARTKAILLEGQTLFLEKKYDDAYKVIGDVLAEMSKNGPYSEVVKTLGGAAPAKKDPLPKAADPAPKKADGPKKEPEPKKEAGDDMAAEPDAAARGRLAKLADSVDKYRRDLIVLALKIRVKQGQAEKGAEQIELLKKFGGSIEANVGTLEQVTSEMAGQIVALRRDGKADEAKALTDGFAKLLDKVSAEPNLPASVQRFLGQSLILVGEYEKAIELLKKIPAPPDRSVIAKPGDIKDNPQLVRQVLEYRRATLELVRALRLAKKYPDADALLLESMGTAEKPGWAANSIDFRKEVAYLWEAKGADDPVVKSAGEAWGKALKEWTAQYSIYSRLLQAGVPKGPNGPDNQKFLATKNSFFEAFYNVQRCLVKANRHLLQGPKFQAKLQKTYDDVGKKFADLEKSSGADMIPEVREKYYDLLIEIPELKKSYESAGGKLFLDKPPSLGGI